MFPYPTTPAQRVGACFARFPGPISLPRMGGRVGLRNVLFEDCSAFTRVTACTLAKSPNVTLYTRGFSHFVTSMTAPIATGWSKNCRMGFAPTEKRRLSTAHAKSRPSLLRVDCYLIDSNALRDLRSARLEWSCCTIEFPERYNSDKALPY